VPCFSRNVTRHKIVVQCFHFHSNKLVLHTVRLNDLYTVRTFFFGGEGGKEKFLIYSYRHSIFRSSFLNFVKTRLLVTRRRSGTKIVVYTFSIFLRTEYSHWCRNSNCLCLFIASLLPPLFLSLLSPVS